MLVVVLVVVWFVDSMFVLGSARFGMADPERIRVEGKQWRRYEKSGGAPAASFDSGRFGSEPISPTHEGSFPSGQRGLTVNQVALPSQVRILHFPLFMRCPDIEPTSNQIAATDRFIANQTRHKTDS